MDYETAQRFKPFTPHESVRWTGRPRQGIAFRPSDLLVVPFSLLWCGFAVFWESLAVASGVSFMMLWGVPFVLVGLYMVIGRFLYDAYLRSRTYYALTDHSALILAGITGAKLTTVDLKSLQESHLRLGGGNRGTITFGPDNGPIAGFGRRYVAASPEFFSIEDASAVYTQVQQRRREVSA